MSIFKRILSLVAVLVLVITQIPVCANELKPFKQHKIPGTINACDFDNGGPGVAYSPLSNDRLGTYEYRKGVELDFYNSTYGVTMGFNSGSWMKYTVSVDVAGEYEVAAVYAVPNSNCVFEVSFDDEIFINAPLPATGSWTELEEHRIGVVNLTRGKHIMQYKMVTGGITLLGVRFTSTAKGRENDFSSKTGSYRNIFIPAIIEAEDFDLGADGSFSIDGVNDTKKYRKDAQIDILEKGKSGYKIKLNNEEYVKYTFNVEHTDAYTLKIAADTEGVVDIYFDDLKQPITKRVEGGVESEVVSVYLEGGQHSITLKAREGAVEIDYLTFTAAQSNYITLDSLQYAREETKEDGENVKIFRQLYVSTAGSDDNSGSAESPFATISRAKQEIEKINDDMDGDIIVNIEPGYYQLDKEEVFTEKHSGKNGFNVIFRGSNRIKPPIISGGTRITGWEKTENEIWKAPANIQDTRTLYINGFAAQRARSKYIYECFELYNEPNSKYIADGAIVSSINFPDNLTRTNDMELVWDILWTCQRTPVEDIFSQDNKTIIKLKQPYFHWARTKSYEPTNPKAGEYFYLENALELLDEPGEFYFDKAEKTIYYYPFKNEDLTTAETYVGTTEFMVRVGGADLQNKVTNIIFDNLDFRYGAWNGASETGVVGVQADKILSGENDPVATGGRMLPAQFKVYNAKNIVIKNCRFSSLGSGAISMDNGVSDSKIIGNVIKDCSGTAIIAGHWEHRNVMPEGMERCVNIEIANNVIRRASGEFRGGCGISLYYVNSVNVHHNDIKELPYTGISLGWGWGEDIKDSAQNTIAFNRIEDVTNPTHDGAHIYTLGPLRNTLISHNYCIKAGDYRGGIYADQGTAYVRITNNVVAQSHHWLFARENANLKEIYVDNNFTDTEVMAQDKQNVTVANTTVVKDGKWPQAAVDIMNAAGVEAPYRRLLNGVERPAWRKSSTKIVPNREYRSTYNSWIQAEDFMEGGEGVGYHKLVQENKEGIYRKDGVAIYAQGRGNYVIGNTKPGEWLKYKFEITESHIYNLELKVANAFDESEPIPRVKIYLDDELIVDKAEIPNNGSWQRHIPVFLGKFYIDEGTHTLTVEFDNNGFSFDAWKFSKDVRIKKDPDFDEGIIVYEQEYFGGFTDIEGHWAEEAIIEMAENGIIKGVEKSLFAPEDKVTFYQSIWLCMRTANIPFTEDNWQQLAEMHGLLTVGQSDFIITREQFAEVVMKTYLIKNGNFSLTYNPSMFLDMNNIGAEYLHYVLGVKELGLMTGDADGKFNPKAYLTRAEAATVIQRMSRIY